MNKRDLYKKIKKLEAFNKNDDVSKALFAKFEANRRREAYKPEYECLIELGIIEEVVAPNNAVNLFDTMKKQRKLVNEALKDPEVKAKVERLQKEFKEQCKKERR